MITNIDKEHIEYRCDRCNKSAIAFSKFDVHFLMNWYVFHNITECKELEWFKNE